jgi:uncharacterized membrane protein YgdD (TMEM256/DUF423 family)
MNKIFLKIGFLSGAVSVALGAFGAHALKKIIDAEALAIFETANRYQFIHALALILASILFEKLQPKKMLMACRCFTFGTLIFSGSLYALAILGKNYSFLGAITPLGGLMFILGWLMLFFAASPKKEESTQ